MCFFLFFALRPFVTDTVFRKRFAVPVSLKLEASVNAGRGEEFDNRGDSPTNPPLGLFVSGIYRKDVVPDLSRWGVVLS